MRFQMPYASQLVEDENLKPTTLNFLFLSMLCVVTLFLVLVLFFSLVLHFKMVSQHVFTRTHGHEEHH
jgi:hypothetical protein